ncbi:MAG: FtsX-like permease family protein, partial [Gemmatimonadetes bacterium]|nr:FtsX-like permease family protein [Gemmatimonadota bacterium]
MIRYVALQFLQGLRARPLLFLLTVAGVALGVASVVTVQLLNQGAISAFRRGLDATSGGSALIVRPRGPVLEADALATGLSTPGVDAVHPVHRISTRVLGASEGQIRQLSVVGLDVMAGDGGVTGPNGDQAGLTPGADESQVPTIFTNPSLLLSEGAAESLASFLGRSLVAGDTLSLAHGSLVHGVTVARIIPGNASTAVMDLAWSQHLFGEGLTQLNVDLTSSGTEQVRAVAASLERRLGPGVRITTPDEEGLEGESLLSAFRLNLTALSLISVFVGAFLVYGTTRASLVRRRGEFGVLRSLGASRGQLLGVVSADVALLGLTGILVGLPAGYLAARANLDAVSGTITNLYLLEAIQSVPLPPWIVALAVAIGLAAAALGGALPAVETVGARIRSLLSGRQRPSLTGPDHRTLAKGALAAAAAGLLLA